MTTTTKRWTLIYKAKDGHRFFKDAQHPDAIAVADESGDGMHGQIGKPDETDDGILYLDLNEPVQVRREHKNYGKYHYTLSLRVGTPDGEASHTPASIHEARGVVERFGLKVDAPDGAPRIGPRIESDNPRTRDDIISDFLELNGVILTAKNLIGFITDGNLAGAALYELQTLAQAHADLIVKIDKESK